MDKLKIAVVITKELNPEKGGGYGYYESLIKAIDNYKFHPLLDFVFIQFEGGDTFSSNKELLQFNFNIESEDVKRCYKRIALFNRIPFFSLKAKLTKKYKDRLLILKNKNAVQWLISQDID